MAAIVTIMNFAKSFGLTGLGVLPFLAKLDFGTTTSTEPLSYHSRPTDSEEKCEEMEKMQRGGREDRETERISPRAFLAKSARGSFKLIGLLAGLYRQQTSCLQVSESTD